MTEMSLRVKLFTWTFIIMQIKLISQMKRFARELAFKQWQKAHTKNQQQKTKALGQILEKIHGKSPIAGAEGKATNFLAVSSPQAALCLIS